jgi:hypothetical protein
MERLGVVTFADATYQGLGPHVTKLFARALAEALGDERVALLATTGADVGFVGVGQAQRLARPRQLHGLVTGQVLAHARGPSGARAVVGVRLLDANRGSIIWSRTVTGRTGATDTSTPNADLDMACTRAAKELINDLLAPPPDAAGGVRHAHGRGHR